jgi:hypothetical protein
MDEDIFYQQIMTNSTRRPSHPPPYDPALESKLGTAAAAAVPDESSPSSSAHHDEPEHLPPYSTTIDIQGVFSKKHEIESTTKRAIDRQWHTVLVTLQGTALNIYHTKKDWGWGRTRDGPSISPDNPPWVRKAKLEKSYSLLYADAGIAADYNKRRYVIRIRAETDQFLLSCVELTTFCKWLNLLFSAIDVAAPIDIRDYPREMSVPRILRIRFSNGQPYVGDLDARAPDDDDPQLNEMEPGADATDHPASGASPASISSLEIEAGLERQIEEAVSRESGRETQPVGPTEDATIAPRAGTGAEATRRLSTSSYPNDEIDQLSGKWYPEHHWTSNHDLLYAKLCYNNLLFRSPRRSKRIISNGREWHVDWTTGRMVRVLPPQYGEIGDYVDAWQFVHTTENTRI